MKDYTDLYDLYMGNEDLLAKNIKQEMTGLTNARQAFSEDPFSAPVPPKQSKRYVPENVPEPAAVRTRAGAQRAAGQIAEGIKPTFATKVLGLNKPPSKLRARATTGAGIAGTVTGMAAPILANWGGNLLAGWRAGKEQKKLVGKEQVPAPAKQEIEKQIQQVKQDNTQALLKAAASRGFLALQQNPDGTIKNVRWTLGEPGSPINKYIDNWLNQAEKGMDPLLYQKLVRQLPR